MNNIYIFGDTHGTHEIDKIFLVDEYEKDDFIIVCGDFGVLWKDEISPAESHIMNEISKLPCTLLFVDGNHENFNRLKKLKSVQKFGGVAGEYIKDKCYHLRRGEIYTLAGKNTFVMGGALSIDKRFRTPNLSWWADEAISDDELMRGVSNLKAFEKDIDLVITHTCPQSFFSPMRNFIDIEHKIHDENSAKLEKLLNALVDKKQSPQWFFGHWHADFDFEFKRDESTIKAHCLYDEMFDLNAHTRELLNHAYRLAKQEQMLKYGSF